MARPTICTQEITEQIAKYLAEGQYMACACALCEPIISVQDAHNWKKWGEEGKDATGPNPDAYRAFFEAVTRAEAKAERAVVLEMRRAALPHSAEIETEDGRTLLPGDLRAQETFLKRRFPHRWGDMQRTELSGPGGGPMHVETKSSLALLADPEACALATKLISHLSGGEEQIDGPEAPDAGTAD